jgi:transposase
LVWALAKTAVSELMRIAWRSVGWICRRVTAEESTRRDLLAGLSRLGFDEISVRKGQRYLTVIVDHDTGRLVWAHPGRVCKTVEKFLDLLGHERCNQITLVSCDDAEWITRPVSERCETAVICWTRGRREVWNDARRQGQQRLAKELKGARFALWKNPENLTARQ